MGRLKPGTYGKLKFELRAHAKKAPGCIAGELKPAGHTANQSLNYMLVQARVYGKLKLELHVGRLKPAGHTANQSLNYVLVQARDVWQAEV